LLFHPQAPLRDEEMYQDGRLILQDKASCMPAVVLSPPSDPQAFVIDATAGLSSSFSIRSSLLTQVWCSSGE
jgi:25S rRNA (cytosine2278-C5)-methyltransferase